MLLEGRRVVITGGGGGIGRALALALASRGARLVLIGRHAKTLDETVALLPQGSSAQTVVADITTPAGRSAIVQACRISGLDILINNAGTVTSGIFDNLTDGDLETVVATNVTAPMALIRDLLPVLRKSDRPRIVNIGSVFGDIGHPCFAAYCATKFALRGLSDALRRELADYRIGVTYAAPRATRTAAADGFHELAGPFGMAMDDPRDVAARIVAAIEREANTIYARGPEQIFVLLQRLVPGMVDWGLIRKFRQVRLQLRAATTH